MRRLRRWLALALAGLAAVAGLYAAWGGWRARADLDLARRALDQRRWAEARDAAQRALDRRPGDGEALYRLGLAEQGAGGEARARKTWERVPAGSPFAGRAAVEIARVALRSHRLGEAERWMDVALRDADEAASREAFETLISMFRIEGRYAEAIDLVRSWAGRFESPIHLLRELAVLGSAVPHKIDLVRTGLATASRSSPDDDRVWLGWANLATRTDQFDTARQWLDRCEKARPGDPAVTRARLDLAMATEDVPGAWQALARLPASGPASPGPSEVLGLRAWFAARAGDAAAERAALAERLRVDPGHLATLDRLAELELRAGHAMESGKLRARKAELDRVKARYDVAIFRHDSPEQAAELAAMAEQLHRPVEARVLWSLAARWRPGDRDAENALARLDAARPPDPPGDATLAGLLARRPAAARDKAQAPAATQPGGNPRFVDDAEAAGLAFRFDRGLDPDRHLPETMSGGVGLLDHDGDGWLDVYCVQGGPFPPDPTRPPPGDRLFRNRGDGTFEDATDRSGIAALPKGYGHGVAVGDVDNDGHPDLFVTRWDAYALLRNRGDGTFEDATDRAGLAGPRDWPTSAAFADLDGDGDLDLYVCHYLEWDPVHPDLCRDPKTGNAIFCGPPRFRARPDHLFRNDGGRFVDVTAEAGIVDADGRGLGVVASDLDGDGKVDLFVANDQSANFLFRNKGGMRFEEVGGLVGVASNADGQYKANMGIACGDVDGDGRPDLAVTEFYNEGTTLYANLGGGIFADHSASSGIQRATRTRLGFGVAFLDYDADGRLDLASTNGHVDDFRPAIPLRMPAQLLAGTARGKFADVTPRAGAAWLIPRLGRGLAAGDLDNDGRVDLVLLGQDEPLAYLHNRTEGGRWLTLRLEGTKSNRDAVGAKVTITVDGRTRTAWRFGGGSYQSASDGRVHFGLGPDGRLGPVEVAWPSGVVERFEGAGPDAAYRLREGTGRAEPLAGFARPPR